jgi:toxin ParE1/3/4
LRFAYELGLPGLRAWPMKKHPFVIFYVERADHIDIWRVQHGARDIPDSLRGSIPSG